MVIANKIIFFTKRGYFTKKWIFDKKRIFAEKSKSQKIEYFTKKSTLHKKIDIVRTMISKGSGNLYSRTYK